MKGIPNVVYVLHIIETSGLLYLATFFKIKDAIEFRNRRQAIRKENIVITSYINEEIIGMEEKE